MKISLSQFAESAKSRVMNLTGFSVLSAIGFIGTAHAELPAAVATAFTGLLADVQSLIDLAWTVVVPITVAFIVIGLFKRAAYSAT